MNFRCRLASLSLTVILAGCGGSQTDFVFTNSSSDAPSGHVMAVYMVGSDLESDFDAATQDLLEMVDGLQGMSVDERQELELFIAFGGAEKDGWRGVRWMDQEILLEDATNRVFGDLPPDRYLYQDQVANMAESGTLTQFLSALRSRYVNPRQRFVVLWNHGGGYSGYGYDEVFGKILSLPEIDSAFAQSGLPRLELLGFDACLMASVEVTSALRTRARFMIASEETEPSHGWNYRYVVPNYLRTNSLTEYGIGLVDNYVDNASHDEESDGKTLALLDLEQVEPLLAALNAYGTSYAARIGSLNETTTGFVRATVQAQSFGVSVEQRHSIDLQDFLSRSTVFNAEQPIAALALEQAIDNLIVYAQDDGTVENANGLGIVPPDLNAARLPLSDFPSSGWSALTRASLELIASDVSPPTLSDLVVTGEGVLASFVDPLLVRVSALYGWRTGPDLFVLESSPAVAQAEAGRWLAPRWDGQAFHLVFHPELPAQPLPVTYGGSQPSEQGPVDLYLTTVELRSAGDSNPVFKRGTLTLAVRNGTVEDYQVETYQLDSNGRRIEDRTLNELQPGDQLKLFATTYREGSQFDLAQRQLGETLVLANSPTFARQTVAAPAGSDLGFAILGQDFTGQTTVSPFQTP